MSSENSYELRKRFIDIARRDRGKVESTKNQAEWIRKLWPATTLGMTGYIDRQPYCAAGMAYCLREWVHDPEVQKALGLTSDAAAEQWRCKSASVMNDPHSNWVKWAKQNSLIILQPTCILHAGDLAVYKHSHIECVTDDDNTPTGPFVAIGYNTNASGSRDGEGCFEKPRNRSTVELFIRILS